jgi:hypothetical protein
MLNLGRCTACLGRDDPGRTAMRISGQSRTQGASRSQHDEGLRGRRSKHADLRISQANERRMPCG